MLTEPKQRLLSSAITMMYVLLCSTAKAETHTLLCNHRIRFFRARQEDSNLEAIEAAFAN